MKKAALPPDEKQRLETLKRYEILDTLPERDFDDLTAIAAHICDAPIALISLVDESRQWFKSEIGLGVAETPRDIGFCAHTILQESVFVVSNAEVDERFLDNPLVSGETSFKFYAGAPLIAPNGQRLGSLCVIDHRARQADPKMIAALEGLARQVISQFELRLRVRELEKSRGELKASNEQLLAAYNEKARFVATLSHELRTPMTGIMGLTEILLYSNPNEEQQKNLKLIDGCSENMLDLLNDVIDLSKLEAGHLELQNISFSVKENFDELMAAFAAAADSKKTQLRFQIAPEVPKLLFADSARLNQVVSTLLNNAVKSTEGGEIEVSIGVLAAGDSLEEFKIGITVRDTGSGMHDETQASLFTSFRNVGQSRQAGTGLGLSVAKALSERMGGTLSVQSAVGQGSTFVFEFSAFKAVRTDAAKCHLSTANGRRRAWRVIIADDNEMNLKVGVAMLKKLGCEAIVAKDGNEVIRILEYERVDLILMDKNMPHLDGVMAAKQIVDRWAPADRPPIIAVTANTSVEDRQECIKAGMEGFMQKPVRLETLKTAIEQGQRKARRTG